MKSQWKIVRSGVLMLPVLVVGMATLLRAEEKPQAKPVTIVGEVAVAEQDDDGKAIQAALWTEDFDYYLIAKDAKGAELLKLVDKKVSVTGKVTATTDESPVLTVTSYKVVPEPKPEPVDVKKAPAKGDEDGAEDGLEE